MKSSPLQKRFTPIIHSLLVMGSIVFCSVPALHAQDTPSAPSNTPEAQEVKATSTSTKVSPKVDTSKLDLKEVKPDASKAAKDAFNSAKEERLEDLRYKHLWIAYSLVWIIIFLFIRQTWQRSTHVTQRLDELKARLGKLEDNQDQ